MASASSNVISLCLLPLEVTCENIFAYLSLSDLRALDTAYTNRQMRGQLQAAWRFFECEVVECAGSIDDIRWLHGVGVNIVGVSLEFQELDEADFDSSLSFIATNLLNLRKLLVVLF